MNTITLSVETVSLSQQQFQAFCLENKNLRIERDKFGKIIIMTPVFSKSGFFNHEINLQLGMWNHTHRLGFLFDSSSGFTLPNGAMRSADGAFVFKARWKELSPEKREKFAEICPDFVFELRSTSDRLKTLQEKMLEWIENGVKLGWLIDVEHHKIYIYKEEGLAEVRSFEEKAFGGDLLPDFELNFDFIDEI
ncbi:MAG: Uma2 family endonuclease [Bacteroidia bacterium]